MLPWVCMFLMLKMIGGDWARIKPSIARIICLDLSNVTASSVDEDLIIESTYIFHDAFTFICIISID